MPGKLYTRPRMHTLHDLESGALHGARHVRLTWLGLTEFPRALLELAPTLEVLDLSGNQLTTLPADFAQLRQLRIFFASSNPFSELPAVLGQCPQLEMIGFKACRIAHVPAPSLPARLRWLILTDNQITHLPDALGQRPRLQKLMLSCNQLSTLPDLSACHRLELLRIASNQFTAVPDTLLTLPSLAWPALAGNPMTLKSEQQVLANQGHEAYLMQDLEQHELLGEGASGHIYRVTHRPDGQALALKLFKAAATSDGTPQSELAGGLAAGRHPHLLTPLARVNTGPHQRLAMALPLLPQGYVSLAGPPSFDSCTRDVYDPELRFSPDMGQRLLDAISSAVRHLHARDVLHGDLYAHNILWHPATGHAMLSDLGAAMLLDELPRATAAQLKAMECRALQHLRSEVQARCTIPA